MTTEINLDNYHELKEKAGKWDEREKGINVKVYNIKTDTYLCGNCGQFVYEVDNYCADCGQKLKWV